MTCYWEWLQCCVPYFLYYTCIVPVCRDGCFPGYRVSHTRIPRDACVPAHIRITNASTYVLQVLVICVSPGILFPHLRCEISPSEKFQKSTGERVVAIYQNVFSSPDLSPKEMASNKILYQELRRRKEAGEANFISRRGKIVTKQAVRNPTTV